MNHCSSDPPYQLPAISCQVWISNCWNVLILSWWSFSGWPSTGPLLSPCLLYRRLEWLTGASVTRWKWSWSWLTSDPDPFCCCCKFCHSCKLSKFDGQEIPGRSSVWNCDGEILEQPSLHVRYSPGHIQDHILVISNLADFPAVFLHIYNFDICHEIQL